MLRRTSFGLKTRAVTQNRRMAAAMGIRTPYVDALTFGLGSGIAGIAGVALSQIDNVSPNLGQGYIIDSFLVVVFGGVGSLWGTLVAALTLGVANKLAEPYFGAVLAKIGPAGLHHPVHPEAPARAVRAQGPGGGGREGANWRDFPPPLCGGRVGLASARVGRGERLVRRGRAAGRSPPRGAAPLPDPLRGPPSPAEGGGNLACVSGDIAMTPHARLIDPKGWIFLAALAAICVVVPTLNLGFAPGSALHLPTYLVSLFGKYLAFALLALSLDLVWGFCGILSLGHGAFFALGGYAMGMYLMRQIGSRGVYGNPILPDFMVFLNYKSLPWYWLGFDHFAFAALMVLAVPGLLGFVFGWLAFRSRVTGVYLSIITQALTYALMLAFFRNDMGARGQQRAHRFQGSPGIQRPGAGLSRVHFRRHRDRARHRLPDRAVHDRLGLRQDPDRGARCRVAHALPRLPARALQDAGLHRLGDDGRRPPVPSTCRRSGSSTPASSRRPTRSRR